MTCRIFFFIATTCCFILLIASCIIISSNAISFTVCGIMERVSSATAAEVEDAISTNQSGRSGKKRAKVWAYVDTELIDGVEKAVCKYCKLQLSSVPGKGTTHLNRHIGYYCHHIPQEDRDTFLASLKNTPGRDNSVFDHVVFRGLIAKYFLHGEVAFRKADDPTWERDDKLLAAIIQCGRSTNSSCRLYDVVRRREIAATR